MGALSGRSGRRTGRGQGPRPGSRRGDRPDGRGNLRGQGENQGPEGPSLMYLFDTDVISHVLKKQRSASLMARLKETPQASQFTSAVNVAEIYFGVFRKEGR